MERNLVIGNRTLLPIKEAASQVSYSRDYVARLAREGKIAAVQIDRQWYIDPESLLNFFHTSQLELQARAEYIREMRRHDLELRDFVTIHSRKSALRERVATQRVAVETVIVITLALCVGILVHSMAVVMPAPGALLTSVLAPATSLQTAALPTASTETEVIEWWNAIGEITITDEAVSLDNGIVLLPVSTDGTPTTTSPGDLFSDPVRVIADEDGGVIEATVDGVSTTVPFLYIPAESTVRTVE